MFSFRTTPLFEQPDLTLRRGKVGVLCNQSCWMPENGEYLFETVAQAYHLKKIFVPSDGLFCDGQGAADSFGAMLPDVDIVRLVADDKGLFTPWMLSQLSETDALIVSLQDIGSRFDPCVNLLYALFRALVENDINLSVYILDSANPATRLVEGSASPKEFATPLSAPGIPARHGLTIGELAALFQAELGAKFALHVISADVKSYALMPWAIPMGEDRAGFFTALFYSGHYLWKGTNVSFGDGTPRPYERFGAPFMMDLPKVSDKAMWNALGGPIAEEGLYIRWEQFTPRFGLYAGEPCFGFQMLLDASRQYHSLLHALRCIRFVAESCPEKFRLLDSFASLAGDSSYVDFVKGSLDWADLKEHVKVEEQKWIRKAKKYLLYEEQPFRIK